MRNCVRTGFAAFRARLRAPYAERAAKEQSGLCGHRHATDVARLASTSGWAARDVRADQRFYQDKLDRTGLLISRKRRSGAGRAIDFSYPDASRNNLSYWGKPTRSASTAGRQRDAWQLKPLPPNCTTVWSNSPALIMRCHYPVALTGLINQSFLCDAGTWFDRAGGTSPASGSLR